jgi:hypothetical protein
MSTRFNRGAEADSAPRRTIASFSSYSEAEAAVDKLSDAGFPVERSQIVGRDLKFVEQVTGRMGYGRAALRGALTGAFTGLLIGWLFAVFNWFDPIVASGWLILDAIWFGAIVGLIFGLVSHAMLRGRRDFSSVPSMRAELYEVQVDERFADEARALLAGDTGAAREPAATSKRDTAPSR